MEESRGALLLVLGAREHTGVMRLLNGSIGHYCLSHVTCPLVSVPVGAMEEAESADEKPAPAAARQPMGTPLA